MIHVMRWATGLALALSVMAALGVPALALAQGKWVAPAAERDKKNPLPADASTIAQGKKVEFEFVEEGENYVVTAVK